MCSSTAPASGAPRPGWATASRCPWWSIAYHTCSPSSHVCEAMRARRPSDSCADRISWKKHNTPRVGKSGGGKGGVGSNNASRAGSNSMSGGVSGIVAPWGRVGDILPARRIRLGARTDSGSPTMSHMRNLEPHAQRRRHGPQPGVGSLLPPDLRHDSMEGERLLDLLETGHAGPTVSRGSLRRSAH